MFYDRSHGQTSQVFGENAEPFQQGAIRKVVVQKGLNDRIGMGGMRKNLVEFELRWHQDPTQTMERIKDRDRTIYNENPRLARTVDESETVLPSRRETRIHTPGGPQPKMRYVPVGPPLGSGQFATVYKAIDIDRGKIMAVKILKSNNTSNPSDSTSPSNQPAEFDTTNQGDSTRNTSHHPSSNYLESVSNDRKSSQITLDALSGPFRANCKNTSTHGIEAPWVASTENSNWNAEDDGSHSALGPLISKLYEVMWLDRPSPAVEASSSPDPTGQERTSPDGSNGAEGSTPNDTSGGCRSISASNFLESARGTDLNNL
jgi:hypothetical protein